VVWNAAAAYNEGASGQKIYLSKSRNGKNWSKPIYFVGPKHSINPVENSTGRQWQPGTIVCNDQLWCFWTLDACKDPDYNGTYFSYLDLSKNEKWINRKIFSTVPVNGRGEDVMLFVGENPTMLTSGRVIVPVTLIGKDKDTGTYYKGLKRNHYNAFIYTDDDGQTWDVSNAVFGPENQLQMWEHHGYQQADGKIRVFMRNLRAGKHSKPVNMLFTTTATGVNKGTSLIIDENIQFSSIETCSERPCAIKLKSGRYVFFGHDSYTPSNTPVGFTSRAIAALYFSRTGEDDYVAGNCFAPRDKNIAYPQGIEFDKSIYVAYSIFNDDKDLSEPRKITVAKISPVPDKDKFYIWPRSKEIIETVFIANGQKMQNGVRPHYRKNIDYKYTIPYKSSIDEKTVICFKDRGTAGVEIEPVDFNKGQRLKIGFDFKIEQLQSQGNLIILSFGDVVPIRIGMRSGRPKQLCAYGLNKWQLVGDCSINKWQHLEIELGMDNYSIKLNDSPVKLIVNPAKNPNRRLYLGDGYEIDGYESNRNSEFLIDLNSVRTKILN
jgi:hypothetical protein